LVPRNERGRVEGGDPPLLTPGMRYLTVDLQGRLLGMAVMGAEFDKAAAGAATQPAKEASTSSAEPDWSFLFDAAGIDKSAFTPTTPLWIPRVPFDRHVAWTGAFPEHPDVPMRIEAASLRGQFVAFSEYGPWQEVPGAADSEESATIQQTIDTVLFPILIVVVLVSATVLAWRNVRAGRGDRRGAWRLALFLVAVTMLAWIFTAHHVGGWPEYEMFMRGLASSFGSGVAGWIMYLAFEPFARRYWPQSIISWTRLLSGRWRDPLVGRNVLQGALAGASIAMLVSVPGLIAYWSNSAKYHSELNIPPHMLGPRYAIGNAIGTLAAPTLFMGMFVLILLLRIALRKQWLAMLVMALLLLAVMMAPALFEKDGANWYGAASGFVLSIGLLFCLVYLGVLATLVMMIVSIACWSHPFTTDFSNWYAGLGLTGMVMIAAIAGYGFWIALSGQPLLKDELHG
jgi:hypothetical protein